MDFDNFKEFNPEDNKSDFEKARKARQYWEQQVKKANGISFVKNSSNDVLKLQYDNQFGFEV